MLPILAEHTVRQECLVGVYCFMPDHLHLVVCGQSGRADAKRAMDEFKHKSGLWFAEHRSQFYWQHATTITSSARATTGGGR